MTHVAFLGLGAMGSRMAANLIAAGFPLTVWNRSPAPAAALAARGAQVAPSPRDAAAAADVVLAMVYDDPASEAVWLHPETGALAGMRPGALGIDCATISPSLARRLHAAAADRGAAFLDAPLAGSLPQAEAKALVFFAGGPPDAVARAQPVLAALGASSTHVGGPGAGATVKLMVNALFAGQIALMGELLGLAERAGLDPSRALDAMAATPTLSPGVRGAAVAMLARSFPVAAPIDLIVKDMRLALAEAAARGAALPMTEAVGAVYRAAAAEGRGRENVTAIARRHLAQTPAAAE